MLSRRGLITGAAALAALLLGMLGPAQAINTAERLLLSSGSWVLPGAAVDIYGSRLYGCSNYSACFSNTNSTGGYVTNSDGSLTLIAANTLRVGNGIGPLVEPSATNLALRSQQFTVSPWSYTGSPTIADSVITAPDPTLTGSSFVRTTTSPSYGTQQLTKAAASLPYSSFYYVKQNTARYAAIRLQGSYPALADCVFDLQLGIVSTTAANTFTNTLCSISAKSSSGWYQVTIQTTTDAVTALIDAYSFNSNGVVLDGTDSSSSSSGYIWAAQIEQSTYSTSYFPTVSVSLTRSADNVLITGYLASLLASSKGSVGISTYRSAAATTGTLIDANGSILLGKTSSDTLTDNLVAGLTTANAGVWTGNTNSFISWSASGRGLSLNQGSPATDVNAMTPGATFHLGSLSGSTAFLSGYVTRLTVWKSAVSAKIFSPSFTPTTLYTWGDSLTQGGQDGTGVTYPEVLSNSYAPSRLVINEGVGGNTSTQILTRFQALPASWGYPTVIWSGRNDFTTYATTVLPNIATMVADLTTPNQYVVLSVINGEGEPSGSGNYGNIILLNSALSSTYSSRYLNVRSMLVASYNASNPVDVIDHSNDVPPYTLRAVDVSGTITQSVLSSDTTFTTSVNVPVNYIIKVGSEYIYVLGSSGLTVTSCTRGYAGSTAVGYSNGQAFAGTDPLHLNATGYAFIAQWVKARILSLGGW